MIELRYENPELNGRISFEVTASDGDRVIHQARVDLRDSRQRDQFSREVAGAILEPSAAALVGTELVKQLADSELTAPGPVLVRLCDVARQPVEWLWPQRFAIGKIGILAGDPGCGKSTATMDLAARVTTGSPFPDSANAYGPGDVLLLNAEDDAADTIGPRFDAAGGDDSRVTVLSGIRSGAADHRERSFTLDDIPNLEAAAHRIPELRLVIIDPVSAYLAQTDSHNNAEVRGMLAPLAKFAADHRIAVVLVTHLSKGGGGSGGGRAMYRAMGSLAFVAAARTAFIVAKDRDDSARRLFLPIKNNLGNDTTGLAFSLVNGAVSWERDPVSMSADEAIGTDDEAQSNTAIDEAAEWLSAELSNGETLAKEVQARAKKDGIAERTLNRAKNLLDVQAFRRGFGRAGVWVWSLPNLIGVNTPSPDTSVEGMTAKQATEATKMLARLFSGKLNQEQGKLFEKLVKPFPFSLVKDAIEAYASKRSTLDLPELLRSIQDGRPGDIGGHTPASPPDLATYGASAYQDSPGP